LTRLACRGTDSREHPNVIAFRGLMDAVARGDVATMHAALHEDFVNLNDIGAGPWRECHGRDAFFAFFGQFVEYLEGTFAQEIMDVLGYDDHVVAIVHETAIRLGHVFDNRAVYLLKIVDGRWTSLRTMDMDHESINRFWDGVGMPAVEQAAV
jgi:ketosteroid isomerase-like protein